MLWKEVGGSIPSIHCQKSTLRYVNTITNKTDKSKRYHWVFWREQKIQPDRPYHWKKSFWVNLISLIFHALCPAGSNAIFVRHSLSSFPLLVCHPILGAVVVRRCHHSLLLSSAVAVVVVRRRRCHRPPLPLSTAAIFHLRSRHHHSVSPLSLATRSCPSPS
jgi:hypothetical protein